MTNIRLLRSCLTDNELGRLRVSGLSSFDLRVHPGNNDEVQHVQYVWLDIQIRLRTLEYIPLIHLDDKLFSIILVDSKLPKYRVSDTAERY